MNEEEEERKSEKNSIRRRTQEMRKIKIKSCTRQIQIRQKKSKMNKMKFMEKNKSKHNNIRNK